MQEMKDNIHLKVPWSLRFSLLIWSILAVEVSGNPLPCEHPVNGGETCGRGQLWNGRRCEPCPPGYYQNTSNHNCGECKACTPCPDGSISQDPEGCPTDQDTQCVEGFSTPSAKGAITHSEVSSSSNATTRVVTSSSSSSSSSSSNSDDRQTSTAPPPSQEKAREPYKIPFVIACFVIVTLVVIIICLVKKTKLHAGENRGSNGHTPSGNGISGGSYSAIRNGNTTEMADRSTSNSCAGDA